MNARQRPGETGIALIAVLLILSLLMALAVGLLTSINMDSRLRGAFDRATAGFYAAESGLNRGMGNYRNIFLNFNVPSGSDFNPQSITVGTRTVNYQITEPPGNPQSITIPSGLLFAGLNSIEYDYIMNSAAVKNSETEARVNAEFKVGYIPLFQFVAFYKRDLEVAPGADMTLNGRVHSNGDLYLSADNSTLAISDNPPAITTVQVSAQGNIYRGRKRTNTCDSPGTVTVDMLQDVVAPIGNLDPQNLNCSGSTARKIPSSELATWKGSMVNQVESIAVPEPDIAARGTGIYWTRADLRIVLNLNQPWQPAAPLIGPAAPFQYRIEVQDSAGAQDVARTAILQSFMKDVVFNSNAAKSSFPGTRPLFYTDVPTAAGCGDATPATCANGLATSYTPAFVGTGANAGAIATDANNRVYGTGRTMTSTTANQVVGSYDKDGDFRRGGFYNWREQKWMFLLNLNLHDLLQWNMDQAAANRLFDSADRTDGGLVIFLSIQGPESGLATSRYGIRLFGSFNLPFPNMGADPTGVTVVTDHAVYVEGDYNSAATIAAGKQPAAVLADSVNVLSSAYWQATPAAGIITNDAQSNLGLGAAQRAATTTTMNTAFIGGVDDTIAGGGSSGYNGGLENYPRFHESWSNVNFNYLGSFVSLGTPVHVSGAWCGTGNTCNIYNPPRRNYNYDAEFNNVAYLPPLTPRFVYVQQVLFTEEFK